MNPSYSSLVLALVLWGCERRSPCAVERASIPSPDGKWRASVWEAKPCGLSINAGGIGVDVVEVQSGRKTLAFAVSNSEKLTVNWVQTNQLNITYGCTRSSVGAVLSTVTVMRPKVGSIDIAYNSLDTCKSEVGQR